LARWRFFQWNVVFIFITPLKVPILFTILSNKIMEGHARENYLALLWHPKRGRDAAGCLSDS
jgi:hypothetical protein